jgi:flavin reductase (DIM6/NTAB) family NADH-FMN oxidoreductase RutF
MLSFAVPEMAPADAYRLMISVVVPRPIAWVSSIGADGTTNLAPFSFFNAVGENPLTVMFSLSRRVDRPKDTLRNVQETGEFVLNVADETLALAMVRTSGDWPYGRSEFETAALAMAPSIDVRPPRIANATVAMEARVSQIVPVADTSSTMVLGRPVRFHVREDLMRPNGSVDPTLLSPVARLGGIEYTTLGRVFSVPRPSPDEL